MSTLPFEVIQTLTVIDRKLQLATEYLSDLDEERLRAAQKTKSSGLAQNLALWGPLAPKNAISPYATASIINWTLRCVGRYSSVHELGSVLQTKCMLVDSVVVAREIANFERVRDYTPDAKYPKNINLVSLRERMTRVGAAHLNGVPGLEFVAFPLNTENEHWSLALYVCQSGVFAHFDSLGDLHNNLASSAYKLLVNLNFIPHGTEIVRRTVPAIQAGGWQCGYALLTSALYYSGALREAVPDAEEMKDIIEDNVKLRTMIGYLLSRSRQAREVSMLCTARLANIYVDE
jgi:hypothetical protein